MKSLMFEMPPETAGVVLCVQCKSGKQLVGFLFNDFLLLTQPQTALADVTSVFSFDIQANTQFKMYRNVSVTGGHRRQVLRVTKVEMNVSSCRVLYPVLGTDQGTLHFTL